MDKTQEELSVAAECFLGVGRKGSISKTDVLDALTELIDALTVYSDGTGREVELILRADGTATLMVASETFQGGPADSFEELSNCESMDELWTLLQAEAQAPEAAGGSEVEA
jgi:hypothetical protein